jgi:hypothetical protein
MWKSARSGFARLARRAFLPWKVHDDVGQGTQTCPGHMVTFAHGNNDPVDMQGLFKPHRLGINVEESNEENLT